MKIVRAIEKLLLHLPRSWQGTILSDALDKRQPIAGRFFLARRDGEEFFL